MSFDEILSSPPISNNLKSEFSKYMEFTYNNKDDITGQTEYTITLNDNYKYIVDILIVAGGGGSGSIPFGGGGAGGIVYIVNKTLDAGTYKIIVGNGGTNKTDKKNGYDSMITFVNNNPVILDGIALKSYGGQNGLNGFIIKGKINGGNGGSGVIGEGVDSKTFIQENTFWNGQSYISTVFKGASGGKEYSGGGGGSASDGNDIKGGDGRLINITGNNKLYACGGSGGRITVDSNNEIISFAGEVNFDNPGSGGSTSVTYNSDIYSNTSGKPGIVIISYKTEKVKKNKKLFCKVEDSNKNKYILTDKYKQPLQCYNNKCIIFNEKKILEDRTLFNSNANLDKLFIDTKIQCKAIRDSSDNIVDSEPINKSNINFDNYNIASINKNKLISNTDLDNYKLLTAEEIENNFNEIYLNGNELELMELMIQNDIRPKIYNLKNEYNYTNPKSDLLIQEDITKINPKPIPIPSENNNNMFMYIGVGIAIFFFLLVCVYLYYKYRSSREDANDDIGADAIDSKDVKNTNTNKTKNAKAKPKK